MSAWQIWLAVIAGSFFLGGYVTHRWDTNATLAAQAKAQKQYDATLTKQQESAYAASDAYQKELARLRGLSPVVVRVCNRPVQMPFPQAPRRPDAAPEAGSVVQPATQDIGPALSALMLEADRCSAQIRGLQSWAAGL